MSSSKLLFFLFSIVLLLVALTVIAQEETKLYTICLNEKGNFTANSSYQANLNHLLSSLSFTTEINSGFYNSSYGQNPNTVYALALCRGDVKPDSCHSCITDSALELPKDCPNQQESFIWYDDCMLRYSNRSFFGNMESGPYFWMYNRNNVSEPNQFNQTLVSLLDSLKKKAASGGSLRKFAVGNATIPSSDTIYGLVQCTPDLSEQECTDCLNNVTALIPKCCAGRQGGRVISPSCNFRYEKDIFYDPTDSAPTPTSSPSLTPPPPTSQQPSSPEESQSPPPPSTNSATRKGKGSNVSGTVMLISVPLLLLQCLSSMSVFY